MDATYRIVYGFKYDDIKEIIEKAYNELVPLDIDEEREEWDFLTLMNEYGLVFSMSYDSYGGGELFGIELYWSYGPTVSKFNMPELISALDEDNAAERLSEIMQGTTYYLADNSQIDLSSLQEVIDHLPNPDFYEIVNISW